MVAQTSTLKKQNLLDYSQLMSALPPKADIGSVLTNVRFGLIADSCSAAKRIVIRSPPALDRFLLIGNLIDRHLVSNTAQGCMLRSRRKLGHLQHLGNLRIWHFPGLRHQVI
jgi:hypothetical protein